ncbi:MAG TPA: chorismate-binding protein [Phycisphaerales bacterium]|nr:chorismate-binding protein [Phycisphaerales bacterium]
MSGYSMSPTEFRESASGPGAPGGVRFAPLGVRLLSDQLTPVLAYRRLVAPDQRLEPSFLLESVEGGERQGRHSILGAHPVLEIIARGAETRAKFRAGAGAGLRRVVAHVFGGTADADEFTARTADPLTLMKSVSARLGLADGGPVASGRLPRCVLGGWFGYAAYDSARYGEPEKLGFGRAPKDDRGLPELHMGFYDGVVVFDHVEKLVHVVKLVELPDSGDRGGAERAYQRATEDLERAVVALETHSKPLPAGRFEGGRATSDPATWVSNTTPAQHRGMVERAKEYIRAGDIFQVVLGQRFERRSGADPFDVYRSLRVVNPSPYMVYLQAEGCILIASSPEILCRVRRGGDGKMVVTNRPLAGTRRRGATPAEDASLERELLADHKERAEHVMLVDLGRNDVGRVAKPGTIATPALMEIERYSHVMHISSTVTGELREGLDAWDALRAALPVGTISGAPKVRAMQIIDELEPVRRGPYGGGLGYVSLTGEMDIALALRTMVVPTGRASNEGWMYHLQAAGGIVADSEPEAERIETVNKAMALVRAIEAAEAAFHSTTTPPLPRAE